MMSSKPDAARAGGGVQEMTCQQIALSPGLSDADRDNMFYGYFAAASDVGGHFPPIRSFARIFVRRRNLLVFTSNAGAANNSVLLIDPKLTAGGRRTRFGPGLWPGPRRQARRVGGGSRVNGAP
jgi:hypothetical protein